MPSRMVGVSASVNLPLHHKVQKFSSSTGSPGWSRKKGHKTVVCVLITLQDLKEHPANPGSPGKWLLNQCVYIAGEQLGKAVQELVGCGLIEIATAYRGHSYSNRPSYVGLWQIFPKFPVYCI